MAKNLTPNAAQAAALTEGVVTGFLPANTPNQVRTAQACVRRGWATEADGKFAITSEGCAASGMPLQSAAADEVAPAAESVEVAPASEVAPAAEATPTSEALAIQPVTGAVEGLRVHHVEKILGRCTVEGHRNGVMTGRERITRGSQHAEVTLDCGHVRWPLVRVLLSGHSSRTTELVN